MIANYVSLTSLILIRLCA